MFEWWFHLFGLKCSTVVACASLNLILPAQW